MGIDHYENFPVASPLCPPALRRPIRAIYAFARTADDIADEGDADASTRLADLASFRADLGAAAVGGEVSPRWAGVFAPLAEAIDRFSLPITPLADLLDAFTQDVTTTRYADRAAVLDYCRRSANPIGRLLLHLYGIGDAEALRRSDAVCTALQLANFWQDLGRDARRDRLYVPLDDAGAFAVAPADLVAGRDGQAVRALVRELVRWARATMLAGAPLVHDVPGRAGLELRLVVQGGLRVLDRIDALDGATLTTRPVLGVADLPAIAWGALRMRRGGVRVGARAVSR